MTIIDPPPVGPAGIEAKVISPGVIYIGGSNHWRDWLHHVLPGARRREIDAAYSLYSRIRGDATEYTIGGHSLGGAVAEILTKIMRQDGYNVTCVTFGGKRPPVGYSCNAIRYRHKGDIVPLLTPWRGLAKHNRVGKWALLWVAHGPDTYDKARKAHGLK